jgi:hypothetical protein
MGKHDYFIIATMFGVIATAWLLVAYFAAQ